MAEWQAARAEDLHVDGTSNVKSIMERFQFKEFLAFLDAEEHISAASKSAENKQPPSCSLRLN